MKKTKPFLIWVIAIASVLAFASSTGATTIELVGQYATADRAFDVAVAGSYAYIADRSDGLYVIDVSNPSNPTRVGQYIMDGQAYRVAVCDNYAYIAASDGLYIFDISIPSNPTKVGQCITDSGAEGVAVAGNYAYLTAGYFGLYVIDISNPSNPTKVGHYNPPDFSEGYYEGIFILGKYVYVASGYHGLDIFDVCIPSNPTKVGQYIAGSHAEDVAVSGGYAYVTTWNSGLCAIDVSDPSNPTKIRQYDTVYTHDVVVSGNHAYVAADGLCVIDITQSPPVKIEKYQTPVSCGVAVSGSYAYVADQEDGLYIFKIDTTPDTTPPVITINQPDEGHIFTTDTITISGSASDESGIYSVIVNGQHAGTTSWEKSVSLYPGTNTIAIIATDNVGNAKTVYRTVTYLNTGYISVSSAPSGASIYLDGVYKGDTPKTISDVSTGYHTIELSKEGYQIWSTSVYVSPGDTETVSTSMGVTSEATPTIIPATSPTPISTLMDSDSDGVPDEYDYAPYDPNIQTKSDIIPGATPTPKLPGFDVIFAISGLLTIAYLLRRGK